MRKRGRCGSKGLSLLYMTQKFVVILFYNVYFVHNNCVALFPVPHSALYFSALTLFILLFRLADNNLTHCCAEDLVLLTTATSPLKELELGYNKLGDCGVKRLAAALGRRECKLQKLR